MTPQRFEIGQEVVCIKKDVWKTFYTREKVLGPSFNEIVTIESYGHYSSDYGWTVHIKEYFSPNGFTERRFEPVLSTSILNSELSSVPETISV